MPQGRLFVISGPSAVGKGTIVKEIIDSSENVSLSVSATTRGPREGEVDGVHYYFITDDEFLKRVENGGFLEHAGVHGHYYGTPKQPVLDKLAEDLDVILEIDVQGAMQVKRSYDSGVFIFILPPSLHDLRERINTRGTESEADVELRMSKAMGEIAYLDKYDYFVVNDDLKEAVETVKEIMNAEHHRIDEKAASLLEKYKGENA